MLLAYRTLNPREPTLIKKILIALRSLLRFKHYLHHLYLFKEKSERA